MTDAIILVENTIARSLDYDALIKQFAEKKGAKEALCVNTEVVKLLNIFVR